MVGQEEHFLFGAAERLRIQLRPAERTRGRPSASRHALSRTQKYNLRNV